MRERYAREFPSSHRRSVKRKSLESSPKFHRHAILPSALESSETRRSARASGRGGRAASERNYALLDAWGEHEKVEFAESAVAEINKSNLLKVSQMADRGEINNRWGNDAATGLSDAIRKGAVLVTTNPIMVNATRKEAPADWDKVRDEVKQSHPGSSAEQRASLMTMSVVLRNCRELRPIYEASHGEYGYVSLQISPRANRDAARMVEEVEGLTAGSRRTAGDAEHRL